MSKTAKGPSLSIFLARFFNLTSQKRHELIAGSRQLAVFMKAALEDFLRVTSLRFIVRLENSTFGELAKAGGYYRLDPELKKCRHSFRRRIKGKKVPSVEVILLNARPFHKQNFCFSPEQILRFMSWLGLRPATLYETMSLCAQHEKLGTWDFTVVIFGTTKRNKEGKPSYSDLVPVLRQSTEGDKRYRKLALKTKHFSPQVYYAAVYK